MAQAYPHRETQEQLSRLHTNFGLSAALDKLYDLEIDLNYIEPERLKDNVWFFYPDPRYNITFETQINYLRHHYQKDMAKAAKIKTLDCPICIDNRELEHKKTLRVYEFELNAGQDFFIQLTPYPLYKKHFVLIKKQHTPMYVTQQSINDLIAFVDLAPDYTACSNSDIAWAGASILQHHHYQVFHQLTLPIESATGLFSHQFDDINIELLHYPMATIRLQASSKRTLLHYSAIIIKAWRQTDKENTCNFLLKKIGGRYQLYVLLRNPNFRTPEDIQPIKSEGVGIIEVCGCGIYPVPQGSNEKQLWGRIEQQGLDVIHGIIAGNSPIAPTQYKELWQHITDVIEKNKTTKTNERTKKDSLHLVY